MEKARIFISYKRKNKDQVFSIVEKIETQLGVKCWIDLDGLESSTQFASKICNAIDMAEVVLFMHSSVHLDIDFEEDWTIDELNYARAKKKKVVLVKLDNAPLENVFLMKYGAKNNIDSRDETQFQKLLKDLRTWLNLPQKTQDSDSKYTHVFNKEQDSSSSIHTIYANNGELLYKGEMKSGKYHGQGTLYGVDGCKWEGQFVDGKLHGQGKSYYANGKIEYDGQWENSYSHGMGIEYYENGDTYEGEFSEGKPNGQGTYYFANGAKYEGHFENGEFNGEGTLYFSNDNKYVGGFKNGKRHGKGVFYYRDGNRESVIYEEDELTWREW